MDNEEWRPIPGYEGFYEASNLGRIRSVPRRTTSGKVLKQREGTGTYLRVCLSKENQKKTIAVHRLVALAFLENPEGKPEVNHLDGDKHNNAAGNLEWATRSENERHAYRCLGKMPNRPWAGKPRKCARIFTEEQIISIRNDTRGCERLAKEYGVSSTTIKNIRKRKIYKEVV